MGYNDPNGDGLLHKTIFPILKTLSDKVTGKRAPTTLLLIIALLLIPGWIKVLNPKIHIFTMIPLYLLILAIVIHAISDIISDYKDRSKKRDVLSEISRKYIVDIDINEISDEIKKAVENMGEKLLNE